MLDPLIALGAVANVTQFVEFAIRILAKSHAIYNSANGSLVEYDDLSKVSGDVSMLSRKLQESLTTTAASSSLTADDQALCDLCKGCIDVSQELTKALEKLTGQGKPGRFRSFRQALKSVWSKDDIDNLERRVKMYKEELNIRIIVGLRSKIDVVALQQSEGYASLADETKSVVQSLAHISDGIQNGFERQHAILDTLHSRIETNITAHAKQDKEEHEKLSSQITKLSQQSGDQSDRALGAQIDTRTAIETSIDQNTVEHYKTREEMNRLKEQAERQIEVLTEEIRQLKIELEASVKTIVASLGTASKKEKQKLKDISNAKFNLWVAKELILEKLKAFVAMFRFNFTTEIWLNTTDIKSWKLMPYPKPSGETSAGTVFASRGTVGAGEESMAYIHVDLNYPIAARNVPMVRMCLDQGVDVNAKFSDGTTPLMKAVAAAYEVTSYDSIWKTPWIRHDARQIVQLLLDHGANKSTEALYLARNSHVSGRQSDWLMEQLLDPSPHANLSQFISVTDAVLAGEQEKLEDMLTQEPGIWHALEVHGVSPLGAAVCRNNERMVSMLLGRGASPNALDPVGSSPLAIAVASNFENMAEILLRYGANISLNDPVLGLTPLEYAAREGNHGMCGTLLEDEKPQNPYDKKELLSKPFALALRHLRIDVVMVLLEHGADVFMDMEPFLRPEERTWVRFSGSRLSPEDFLQVNLSSFVGGDLRSDLRAVLMSYEIRANKGTSQRSGMLLPDDSHLEDLISFE
ncbi:hypothetical protein GT037_005683 [Alternaria burnsii]|uniref:Fungal N-terminal domain-containing protein n=1 Tax=Alternaria burnsii TaxID=1187904 RepID=A0A8H7EFT3_9PLEO|nr:uncharacterized protein GT037_005683 [Alternaria burnsii]KAF7676178.1 hypothetical protein GT037_005683 [Alternaria burnsii]